MHNRALIVSFTIIGLALGCSGTSVTNVGGSGGIVSTGGDGGKATSHAGSASTALGGTTASQTGGSHALGGTTSAIGSSAIGGSVASSGGSKATGGTSFSPIGGTTSTGGSSGTIGGSKATGGTLTTGGTSAATGGTKAAGGTNATGGSKASGGTSASTGGSKATGGNSGNGGTRTTGGTTGTGGMSVAGGGSSSCTPPLVGSKGSNPLFTDVFTADPAPFVDNCTFYINCGHDEGTGNNFTMYEWFILKSTDMVHWTRTVGMKYTVFSWAHGNAWAGQMVAKGGKYYWYVPVEQGNGNGQMAIGVAVSNSPEGPFTDAIGKPLVDDAFERSNMGFATDGDTPYTIDPTVFVDDDGQAYLHYGGFQRMVNAKLGADMISISGTMKESTPSCYFEAPFLTKRNGTYYEIYACGINPPTIDYATSTSPLGPWTHKGTVLPKMVTLAGQDAATNHSGVAQLGDQWYIVYHVSNGPNGGGTYHREVAMDKLNFNADGTIQQVTPSSGLTF